MSTAAPSSGERVHIAFFGLRNAGKSSVVNAFTGQKLSLVSDVKGTTTDPVRKTMELLPIGPCVIIDTPGADDEGDLGLLRSQRAFDMLDQTDLAILVVDGVLGLQAADQALIDRFREKKIPYIQVMNKRDLLATIPPAAENVLYVSAKTGEGIEALKEKAAALGKKTENGKKIVGDLLSPGDFVMLMVPIDEAAPKGRLILPQQQTIRDILDAGAFCCVVKDTEFAVALQKLGRKPKLVITDSQAFKKADEETPQDVLLTSFSILFARYKGDLKGAVQGAFTLDALQDGDRVLISEGCTHHRQCGDIGTVKLPNLIRKKTGVSPEFSFTSGGEFPKDLSPYRLIIHCGGCMLNEKEMKSRIQRAKEQGVPMTNYGIAIAHLNGILKRSLSPFPDLLA